MTVAELIPILQIAIGPVVLISGVGLLILSLTNRLGRVIDRGRSLASEHREVPESKRPAIDEQLNILMHRARLLQFSIIFAVFCVLFAATLIITLFFTAALTAETTWLIGGLFIFSLGSLLISLVYFLRELNQSLIAFRLDIGK
jgi:Na+/melibiose symporter-like transporter